MYPSPNDNHSPSTNEFVSAGKLDFQKTYAKQCQPNKGTVNEHSQTLDANLRTIKIEQVAYRNNRRVEMVHCRSLQEIRNFISDLDTLEPISNCFCEPIPPCPTPTTLEYSAVSTPKTTVLL